MLNFCHKLVNPFFCADTHFFNKAMIRYQNRGINNVLFETAKEMNTQLIANWNSVVSPSDVVFFIGDFADTFGNVNKIKQIIEQLNGTIYFILGNHDSYKAFKELGLNVLDSLVKIHVSDKDSNNNDILQEIILCHYPILSWDNKAKGSWHLHGHTHGLMMQNSDIYNLIYVDNYIKDIGVDCTNLRPISYNEIKEEFKKIVNPKLKYPC